MGSPPYMVPPLAEPTKAGCGCGVHAFKLAGNRSFQFMHTRLAEMPGVEFEHVRSIGRR